MSTASDATTHAIPIAAASPSTATTSNHLPNAGTPPLPGATPLSAGTTPAEQVAVRAYRQILIWPSLLKESISAKPLAELAGELAKAEDSKWESKPLSSSAAERAARVDAPYGGSRQDLMNEPTFEEIVYFHPFVRDFLYGDGQRDEKSRSLFRLVRTDIRTARVVTDRRSYQLDVDRVELYLAKPNVAILVMEIGYRPNESDAFNLADVLDLQNRVRHVFPPYFMPGDLKHPSAGQIGGNCPRLVEWLDASGEVLASSNFDDNFKERHLARHHFAGFTAAGGEPPVASHWRYLLHPLPPLRKYDDGLAVQQIIDERIPGMTYLSVDDPRGIRAGDLDRLVFCESAESQEFPYAPEFLEPQRGHHAYTRYWHRDSSHDARQGKTFNTLYLCSAFQFIAVGAASNWFFTNLIFNHFRQHYFRIGLIAHMQRAAILKFKDDLAEAVKLLRDEETRRELLNSEYADRVRHVLKSFLKFRSRSFFTEVSNQLQGAELHAWWSEQVGVERLFREVETLAKTCHDVLHNERSGQLSENSYKLAIGAFLIAVVSLIVSLIK